MYINRDSKIWETKVRSSRAYASTLCMTSIVRKVLVEMKFVCTFFDGRLLRQQHFIYFFRRFLARSLSLSVFLVVATIFFRVLCVFCFSLASPCDVFVALCGFIILRAYSMNDWMNVPVCMWKQQCVEAREGDKAKERTIIK